MKILLVTTHLNFGGITSYIYFLAKGLSKKGHKVFVASGGGDFEGRLKEENIPHIHIPIRTKSELSPKVLISSLILLNLVKKEAIDVIHAQTRVTQVAAFLASKISKIPYVATCHGFFKIRLGRKLLGAWGDKTVAISDAVREHLVNDFKLKKIDTRLIYNGIDLNNLKEYSVEERMAFKDRFGIRQGPIVGLVARLSLVKGHRYLIEAMKKVISVIPGAQLLIIGDGPLKEELVSLVKELGIEKSVYFLGSTTDTAEVLSVMDVFVLPSLQEGLGLSVIEALAMKKAVVASDVGGIYAVVKNDATGLLVAPRDSKALADSILILLKDGDLRNKLGQEGRRLVEERFSLDLMVQKIEELYTELTKNK